ncbi:MAG TPA: hypothetical protein VIQ48_02305, partial [Rhodanobacter sp.]
VDAGGGTPRIAVTLDTGGTVFANYLSGSGSNALVFRLAVANGQLDATGISLGGSIDTNGGSIHDAAGNGVVATLSGVAATAGVQVDAVAPTVTGVNVPRDGHYNAGDVLAFSVTTSEAVSVDTGGGTPRLALDVGGHLVYADYVSGSGSDTLVFQYTVQAGDNDIGGVVTGTAVDLNGGHVRDAAGNLLVPALTRVADSAGVVVDTVAPQLVTITRDATDPMAGRQDLNYTVTFDEDVSGVDASDFLLTATGNAHATIGAVSRVNGHTYVVTLQNVGGTGGLQLGLVADGSAVVDAAGNALAISANSAIELVGGVTPVIVPPSDSLPTAPNFHIDQASVGMLALTPVQRSELPTIFFGEAAPLRALDTSTHPIGGVLDGLMALADTQRALDAVARDSFVLPPVR